MPSGVVLDKDLRGIFGAQRDDGAADEKGDRVAEGAFLQAFDRRALDESDVLHAPPDAVVRRQAEHPRVLAFAELVEVRNVSHGSITPVRILEEGNFVSLS